MHRFGWVIAIFVIDRSNSITWGHCKQNCRSARDVLKVPTDMSFRSASKYREHGGKSTTPIRCSPYVSREPTVTGRNIGIHSRTMAERQAPRISPTAELPYEYIRDCLLSLKITPGFVFSIFRIHLDTNRTSLTVTNQPDYHLFATLLAIPIVAKCD